ncbi:MAG: hypothetical protein N2C14_12620 [Planctomycetales bacterium]
MTTSADFRKAARGWEPLLVFLVLAAHAAWPVPDVNEAHYLGKAKHFWNPNWASGDFFLESADAHLTFYVTVGWIASVADLEHAAWAGRILTWLLLAWSWTRLSHSILPRFGTAVLSAAMFVALLHHCNMAGEWVVGGFESKGIAYALVFFGLEALVRDHWKAVWLWLGAAAAFHVLVGGWAVVAAGIAWLITGRRRLPIRSMAPWLIAGGVLSLPGVLPALWLTHATAADQVADPNLIKEANRIYVFGRLSHHLYWPRFAEHLRLRHAVLFLAWNNLVWLALYLASRKETTGNEQNNVEQNNEPDEHDRARNLQAFVLGSVMISGVGMLIPLVAPTQHDVLASLLKFYWHRLSDVMLPVGTTFALLQTAFLLGDRKPSAPRFAWSARVLWSAAILFAALHVGDQVRQKATTTVPRGFRFRDAETYADWKEACQWISENTPADARFLTHRDVALFKWHAGRAEVVNWKDVPQDAASVKKWWDLIHQINRNKAGRWCDSLAEHGEEGLIWLATDEKVGCQANYVITFSDRPLRLPRVYPPPRETSAFAVYRLDAPEDR